MRTITKLSVILLTTLLQSYAQQNANNKKEISILINKYAKSVIEKDSITFYDLFNDGSVTWCAALMYRSQAREVEKRGANAAGSAYISGSYKGFFRSLFRYQSAEDKFDNIQIIEDGTVASVTMDYSFWANNKMTNWGGKYLSLIKREGKWKITGVIYSVEIADYFEQQPLKERQRASLPGPAQ